MTDPRPVGFFDSGVGGLTIWRAMRRLLPSESTLYVADQAYFPYGAKKTEDLIARSKRIVARLLEDDAKLVVVACNTASVQILADLRSTFPAMQFVGVVPVIRTLSRQTRGGTMALLCTSGTAKSDYIKDLQRQFAAGKNLIVVDGSGLEDRIESGGAQPSEMRAFLSSLLQPVLDSQADVLGLGCTHYPLVRAAIKRIVGRGVRIYEPSRPVARRIRSLLADSDALSTSSEPRFRFLTTGSPTTLCSAVKRLMRLPNPEVEGLDLA